MTTMHIRQCPRCVLRFTSSSELEDHLTNDHRPRPTPASLAPAAPTAPVEPMPVLEPTVGGHIASSRSRGPGVVALVAGLLLVAIVAWLAPAGTALITGALVVLLAVCYRSRARARALIRVRRLDETDTCAGLE
jgi:hypothetical protein